jgi:hypothetical protein
MSGKCEKPLGHELAVLGHVGLELLDAALEGVAPAGLAELQRRVRTISHLALAGGWSPPLRYCR